MSFWTSVNFVVLKWVDYISGLLLSKVKKLVNCFHCMYTYANYVLLYCYVCYRTYTEKEFLNECDKKEI